MKAICNNCHEAPTCPVYVLEIDKDTHICEPCMWAGIRFIIKAKARDFIGRWGKLALLMPALLVLGACEQKPNFPFSYEPNFVWCLELTGSLDKC